ncbi:MAG TPA: hypothetical protein VG265_13020 [Gaiellaceae bacterium]|nr:hypothetical protein [Gaiellaceae bacterium]
MTSRLALAGGRLAVAVAILGGAAGCGSRPAGSGPPSVAAPPIFARTATRSCLVARGVPIGGTVDFVGSTASGGAFVAHFGRRSVTVAFGLSISEGETLQAGYRRLSAPAIRAQLGDLLRRYDNVVTLWGSSPPARAFVLLADCIAQSSPQGTTT